MLPFCVVLLLVFPAAVLVAAHGAGDLQGFSFPSGNSGFDTADLCMVVTPPCMNEADRYSLEALRSIHHMMDDDQDGGIEVEESVEFIIEDMKQQQTNKHSNLHGEDQHITVEELWEAWKTSEVHNWTQDDVLQWLKEFVELPQYERNFKDFKVDGNTLPRIAANEPSFLSVQLRVQDQRDKQKLNIKALDVVLFGPPTRPPHNYMKDLLLIVSVVMGVGGCWFARAQNKASKIHISKMMKDLESLQRAEQSLIDLQEQLERAQEEKRNVAEEKQNLEWKMRVEIRGAQEEAHRLHQLRQGAVSELSRLRYAEEELEQVRGALKQAEKDMHASWSASEALQQWLQLTHEVEVQYYNVKKQSAELQLTTAKEEAEKIKKKRNSVLGTLHVAHSASLDQVDQKILKARNALSDVTACLRERLHRWQQIERLCAFPIIRNPGLSNLTAQLYSDSIALGFPRMPSCSCHSSVHGSIEDLLEESPPILTQMPVPPLKRSPRILGSTICRSRRPGLITQQSATMISSDPDLLIPIQASYLHFDEDDGPFFNTLKKQDSQETFSDSDYVTSPPLTKMFASPTTDSISRKTYHDETDLLADSCMTKPSYKEEEASAEFPIQKISVEEIQAPVETTSWKMSRDTALDMSREAPSVKTGKDDSVIDTVSMKISRDRSEFSADSPVRKGLLNEADSAELLSRKPERNTVDTSGRRMYKDKSDLPLDVSVRKILWNEFEASTEMPFRKISSDIMGTSIDNASKKVMQDGGESPFETIGRKITRDSMGMSLETGSRKLALDEEDRQLESTVRAMSRDKMAEVSGTLPKIISRDELEVRADIAPFKILSREKIEAGIDTPPYKVSTEMPECGLESSTCRRMLRDEFEMPLGSLRKRIPRENTESLADMSIRKMSWDCVDVPMEIPKQRILREEVAVSELSSSPGVSGQPDLTVTSQMPWKSSSEVFFGPLSQLVYDGILEKSCSSVPEIPTSSSASTLNLLQSKVLGEVEPPLPPPRVAFPSPAPATEMGNERHKEKERGRKSLKLKNLFKKKNESDSEKLQSGLQKL